MVFPKLRELVLLVIISVIITIIFTWNFSSKIFSYGTDDGDFVLNAATIWYVQDSIASGRIFHPSDYFAGFQFFPQPLTLVYTDHMFLYGLILLPFYTLTQDLSASINLVVFFSLILTLLCSFWSIQHFIKNQFASFFGAIIYTFNPLLFAHFPQHLDFINRAFLPLLFLFAYLQIFKPSFKHSFFLWLSFSLNALSAIYMFIFSLIILPIFAIPLLIFELKKNTRAYLLKLLKTSVIALLFVPIILYIYLPYTYFSQKEMVTRTIDQNIFFSARVLDWLVPSSNSLVYGKVAQAIDPIRSPKDYRGILNYEEHTLFPNIVPLILAVFGSLVVYKQYKNSQQKPLLLVFSLVLLTSFVLSFGPYFQGINGNITSGLPLPYYFFYQLIPLVKAIRVPTRFGFIWYVPFALLVAFGLKQILDRIKNKVSILMLSVGIFLLLFVENLQSNNYNSSSYILSQIKTLPSEAISLLKDKSVLHYPTKIHDLGPESNYYLNWLTQTKEKTVNGNSAYLPTDQIRLLEVLEQQLNQKALEKLRALATDYVVIHKDLLVTQTQKQMIQSNELVYKKGIVWENDQLQVIKLANIHVNKQKCQENQITSSLQLAQVRNYPREVYVMGIKNQGDCYAVYPFEKKYQSKQINSYDLFGQPVNKTVDMRLPVIIDPKGEILISGITNDLRIY